MKLTEPMTDAQLHTILDAAKAAGDEQTARLAHQLLWTREFSDQARDLSVALAKEARRALPVLSFSIKADKDLTLIERVAAPLRQMIEELLDNRQVEPEKSHWAARAMAESLRRTTEGAPNFVTAVMVDAEGEYVVTVQKPGGKNPADLVDELKADAKRLREALQEVQRCNEGVEHAQECPRHACVDYQECPEGCTDHWCECSLQSDAIQAALTPKP